MGLMYGTARKDARRHAIINYYRVPEMRTIIVRKLGPRNWMCYVIGISPVLLTDIKTPRFALERGQYVVQNQQYL